MLNTQQDIENYVYSYVTKELKSYVGRPLTNGALNHIKYIKQQINKEIAQLIPIAILPPKIDISQDDFDKGLINITITPDPAQYKFSYKFFQISDDNIKTHSFNNLLSSEHYNVKCKNCGYMINKDTGGYYSYVGDFSCDEYVIKNIIE